MCKFKGTSIHAVRILFVYKSRRAGLRGRKELFEKAKKKVLVREPKIKRSKKIK